MIFGDFAGSLGYSDKRLLLKMLDSNHEGRVSLFFG